MNYPVWQLGFSGGGLLIALVAIFHVYLAQFAVGGGLFLVVTELKGRREKNKAILEYVFRHTRFFVLVTMVLGAVSGIGIWFTISVLSPRATSILVHNFLFAWATEWLFFLAEILSLYVYYKTFDTITEKTHLRVGWIYAGAALLSLFVINGIIDFMLTPGDWTTNGSFWSGFFNPTFWPAFFFRAFFALMIAGLFGFVTATWLKNEELRIAMTRYCARWVVLPFVLFLGAAVWYRAALPEQLETLIFTRMPAVTPFIQGFLWIAPLLVFGGVLLAIRFPAPASRGIALVLLLLGLLTLGSFEFVREGGRRPYLIYDHLYSNGILKSQAGQIAAKGVLRSARWAEHKEITDETLVAAGREVFDLLCLHCHSIGGPLNDMKKLGGRYSVEEMEYVYRSMGKERQYMPPFVANEREKEALNAFLRYGL